jgi:mono/diheme cytochrome c family protein
MSSFLHPRGNGTRIGLRVGKLGPVAFLCASILLLTSCQQQMAQQPKYLPLSPSSFFADGRSARPQVDDTVPYGSMDDDYLNVAPESNQFPFPVTSQVMERGQQRFNVYCAPCHGLLGDGNGIITQRGLRHPPSYHIERLRNAPVGHFYDVITHGFGAMQDYSAQVSPHDRWAIIAYIRALQLSQNATSSDVPQHSANEVAPAAPGATTSNVPANSQGGQQ